MAAGPNISPLEGLAMTPYGPVRKRWLALATLAVFAAPILAHSAPPKYDPATETKLKGVVDQLKLVPPTGGKPLVYLLMKEKDSAEVFLCPKSFLDQMGVDFKAGDEIEIVGSKVKQDSADLILTREITKGGDTLTLRFKDGKPAW